jgi:hypothetical protein
MMPTGTHLSKIEIIISFFTMKFFSSLDLHQALSVGKSQPNKISLYMAPFFKGDGLITFTLGLSF